MSSQLEVKLTNEHLNNFLKTKPINAIEELIWNSLDADADKIEVMLNKNPLGGIEEIIVKDNGSGIDYEKIEKQFGKLGESHKANERVSPKGRRYHGKEGSGRYRAFVLGNTVEWLSNSIKENKNVSFSIFGNVNELKKFSLTSPEKTRDQNQGVTVKVQQLNTKNIDKISNSFNLANSLGLRFAPYLKIHQEISISIDGIYIEPDNYVKKTNEFSLMAFTDEGQKVEGVLSLIEWENGSHKNLFICGEQNNSYEEVNSGIRQGVFSHTAYLKSDIVTTLLNENTYAIRDMDERYKLLIEIGTKKIKELYRNKLAEEALNEVKKLKSESIYPYVGEASSSLEIAERQVFDIFAYKLNEFLPEFSNSKKESKKFTYRLLKEALESNPSSLRVILEEVLELDTSQQNELASILEKTSLDSIINTTKLITNRISFLNGLENILYGQDYIKKVKERSQLHKILLGELWLFGEQYQYSYDDISLKNILKKHIQHLDRTDLIEQIDYDNIKNLNDIPDIGLSRQYLLNRKDSYENLVIELKRPSCTIGQKEINQIENYAYAIEENEYFDKEKTKWIFILVGVKLNNFAIKKVKQSDRALGLIYTSEHVEVWVKEWNQIIQDAKGKYQHLKDQLEFGIEDNEEGLKYLQDKYNQYMPE